jgi:hypothetical protein
MATTGTSLDLLDHAAALIDGGQVESGMGLLHSQLPRIRAHAAEWSDFCRQSRSHALFALLQQEPLTKRAFEKPRGYAGDAELLDLMYDEDLLMRLCQSPVVKRLSQYNFDVPTPRSVRWRRDYLAQCIDAIAADHVSARMLSVACGHLREGERSSSVSSGALDAFICVDQDRTSLASVQQRFGDCVRVVPGSVKQLLSGAIRFDSIDFAYTAGLYDYLSDAAAAQLTRVLFDSLRSRGRLLIANFSPENSGTAYMEAFMDWHLTYRNERDCASLAHLVPQAEQMSSRTFRDPHDNVVYLELIRR